MAWVSVLFVSLRRCKQSDTHADLEQLKPLRGVMNSVDPLARPGTLCQELTARRQLTMSGH
jgi:hypothetical protein